MRPRQSLAFRLVATGTCFLVVALLSIALTLWVTWQLEGGAAAVNEAGRMRMMTYRLALDAASGKHDALPAQLRTLLAQELRDSIAQSLAFLSRICALLGRAHIHRRGRATLHELPSTRRYAVGIHASRVTRKVRWISSMKRRTRPAHRP